MMCVQPLLSRLFLVIVVTKTAREEINSTIGRAVCQKWLTTVIASARILLVLYISLLSNGHFLTGFLNCI